ncbi:helix-turn-helix domain-containing protein [Methylobacterium sp. SI9]|uniref:helix-turn-helix domain-containing protein n=1 Tax=Methylobacterium guangdongense TaxID=3138811 RepID=UPI00313C77C7
MMSIAEIAARDGVSKPTVSIAVKRLVEQHNLSVQRDRQGRVALVNVVQYDRLRGQHADLSKAQAPRPAALEAALAMPAGPAMPIDPSAPVYTVEQARNMAYKAELARLDLEERQGKIVHVDAVRACALRAGEEIVRVLERLPQAADDLAVALTREGSHGVRLVLKQTVLTMRRDIADALADAMAEALKGTPVNPVASSSADNPED